MSYLNWHGAQIGAKEKEPHQLVGVYGDQVSNLSRCHVSHGQVRRAETHNLVVDFCLRGVMVNNTDWKMKSQHKDTNWFECNDIENSDYVVNLKS